MALISSIMHRYGYRILRYLDDWLILGSSLQEITRARDLLLWLCNELGVQVNLVKSSLTPTQTLDYLGMTLQSTPLRAFPSQARIRKVLSLVEEFSSSGEQPLSLWRSLLCVMSSLSALVPGSRLRMRSLQFRLNVAGPQASGDALISWDDSCHIDLRWLSVASRLEVGVSLVCNYYSSPTRRTPDGALRWAKTAYLACGLPMFRNFRSTIANFLLFC